jgi:hypothetical protein
MAPAIWVTMPYLLREGEWRAISQAARVIRRPVQQDAGGVSELQRGR